MEKAELFAAALMGDLARVQRFFRDAETRANVIAIEERLAREPVWCPCQEDPWYYSVRSQSSVFERAVWGRQVNLLRWFLEPPAYDALRHTLTHCIDAALATAAVRGDPEVAEVILSSASFCADLTPDQRKMALQSAMAEATRRGNRKFASVLVAHGAEDLRAFVEGD